VFITFDAKDYYTLDEPIEHTIHIDLPPKAMKIYKSLEDKMFADITDDIRVAIFNAGNLTMKSLQCANGAMYIDEYMPNDPSIKVMTKSSRAYAILHSEKLDALESIIEEANSMPVLVVYTFTCDLERIKAAFSGARELGKDPETINAWNRGEIPLLLVHPAAAAHGLNLQYGGNIIVFYSHWWNLDERMQVIERLGPMRQKQAGLDRPVFIYNIVAKNTMDEVVLQSLRTKKKVQEVLLQMLKDRK